MDEPTNNDEVVRYLVDMVSPELSIANILKNNKGNIPLLASFYTLCTSLSSIYCAVSYGDGGALFFGMKQLVVLILLTCLKTGQFGLKSIGDIASLICRPLLLQPRLLSTRNSSTSTACMSVWRSW